MLSKNKMSLNSNIVAVGLEFSFAKGAATFVVQIFWFTIKFGYSLSKNQQISAQNCYQ